MASLLQLSFILSNKYLHTLGVFFRGGCLSESKQKQKNKLTFGEGAPSSRVESVCVCHEDIDVCCIISPFKTQSVFVTMWSWESQRLCVYLVEDVIGSDVSVYMHIFLTAVRACASARAHVCVSAACRH